MAFQLNIRDREVFSETLRTTFCKIILLDFKGKNRESIEWLVKYQITEKVVKSIDRVKSDYQCEYELRQSWDQVILCFGMNCEELWRLTIMKWKLMKKLWT